MCIGSKYEKEPLVEPWVAITSVIVFIIYTILSTLYNAKEIRRIHVIKRTEGYYFDPKDMVFDDNKSLVKITTICFLAGAFGGVIGAAGGIILGPLFLSFGMIPIVVAGTN
jgi:hypothetical protein